MSVSSETSKSLIKRWFEEGTLLRGWFVSKDVRVDFEGRLRDGSSLGLQVSWSERGVITVGTPAGSTFSYNDPSDRPESERSFFDFVCGISITTPSGAKLILYEPKNPDPNLVTH